MAGVADMAIAVSAQARMPPIGSTGHEHAKAENVVWIAQT